MKNKKIFIYFITTVSIMAALSAYASPFSWPGSNPNPESPGTQAWLEKQIKIIQPQAKNIDKSVLRLSLTAYMNARKKGLDKKGVLTVIDYSKPSSEKRLWVFDLNRGKTLFNTWVTHGKNTGDVKATSFSNKTGSLKSSLGVFVTDSSPYMGGNGYSLRLKGLEKGVNDNAYNRNVVIHGAAYVNADTIKKYGRIGRSWGCPAVDLKTAKPLINTIKENTLLVAYYPDRSWLSSSKFLTV